MLAERSRMVRHLVPAVILMLTVLMPACSRRSARPAAPAPPPAALASFGEAERSFESGDYAAAIRSYESYLDSGLADNRDRALFRAGLACAFSRDGAGIGSRSRTFLQDLVAQFPSSPYSAPARIILTLDVQVEGLQGNLSDQQVKIRTLTDELKRLKDIDLHRRPTRPPP